MIISIGSGRFLNANAVMHWSYHPADTRTVTVSQDPEDGGAETRAREVHTSSGLTLALVDGSEMQLTGEVADTVNSQLKKYLKE